VTLQAFRSVVDENKGQRIEEKDNKASETQKSPKLLSANPS
jgi:hypothetical protein